VRWLAFLLMVALAFGGCGSGDAENLRDRVQELEQRARAKADDLRARFRQIVDELERAIPEARRTSPDVRRGQRDVEEFLTSVIANVDAYWTQTLRENGQPEPSVFYVWVPPGRQAQSACGPAGDDAAFYCSADDTIYVAQQFAADLYRGVVRGLPGESAGYGRAAGDFAVAYVLAHEYAHNLQHELGVFDNAVGSSARPYELQADCFAGAWAHSVYEQGLLEPGDIEEATNTALAVGDFDYGNAQHHGTPRERRAALLTGYESGDPGRCDEFVSAA
jgi:predicted metalloprotease